MQLPTNIRCLCVVSAAQATSSLRIRPADVHSTTARAHSLTDTSLQPPASGMKICARCRGEELASELASCATGASKSHQNVRLPDQNRPCRPCTTALRNARYGFVPTMYGSPAMPSFCVGISPERSVLRATCVALRAAAVWKKNIDPSAQRIRRPFARSSKPAASGSRSGQCGRLEQLGSDERHGSAQYATIGDYISLCQQLSAAPKHRAC